MELKRRLENLSMPQLRLIVEASKTRSLSQSAENRGITLSAASRSLKDAEQKLGFSLYDRTPTGLSPTKKGTIVANNISAALDLLFLGEGAGTFDVANSDSFSFAFGGSNFAGTSLCAPILAQLSSIWPEVRVRFQTGTTPEILDMLIEGSIDIACTEEIHNYGRDFNHVNIYIDELCVVCSKSVQLPPRIPNNKFLLNQKWVIPSRAEKSARQAIDNFFKARLGAYPQHVIEGDDPIAMYGLAGFRGYFSIAPAKFCVAFQERLALNVLPIFLPNSGRNVSMTHLVTNEKAEGLKQISKTAAGIVLRLVQNEKVDADIRKLKSGEFL